MHLQNILLLDGNSRGSELLLNTNFQVDLTGWTVTPTGTGATSTWDAKGALVARIDASNYSRVLQSFNTEAGCMYELKVFSNKDANGLLVRVGTNAGGNQTMADTTILAGGVGVYVFPAIQAQHHLMVRGNISGGDSFVRSISVKKLI